MDLTVARAARNAGDYDKALRHAEYTAALDDPDGGEPWQWLLELAISRRVVDDLMAQLQWQPGSYRGFSHIDLATLGCADANGLWQAFSTMARTGKVPPRAVSAMADELVDSGHSEEATRELLEGVGCSMAGDVRLVLARECQREGRLDAAVQHLEASLKEAPTRSLGWRALVLALLAQGQIDSAMTHAYFATQLRRDDLNLFGDRGEGSLTYCGHRIFFIDGVFYSVPSADRQVNITYRDGRLVELYNPIPRKWRNLYRGLLRRLLPGVVLRGLQRMVFRSAPAEVAFTSSNLFELTTAILRQGAGHDTRLPVPGSSAGIAAPPGRC
jgi:hypothetical protein